MANTDTPLGLRPVTGGKAGTTPQLHEYTLATSTTIFQGTPVALDTSGLIVAYLANTTDAQKLVGVASAHRTASQTILVYDDPDQEFEIQSDDNSVTNAGSLRGVNFTMITPTSGNTTNLQSIAELDGSSGLAINTGTTVRPLKGLRFSQEIQNDLTSFTNIKVVVKFNPRNHIYAGEGLGIA